MTWLMKLRRKYGAGSAGKLEHWSATAGIRFKLRLRIHSRLKVATFPQVRLRGFCGVVRQLHLLIHPLPKPGAVVRLEPACVARPTSFFCKLKDNNNSRPAALRHRG